MRSLCVLIVPSEGLDLNIKNLNDFYELVNECLNG